MDSLGSKEASRVDWCCRCEGPAGEKTGIGAGMLLMRLWVQVSSEVLLMLVLGVDGDGLRCRSALISPPHRHGDVSD